VQAAGKATTPVPGRWLTLRWEAAGPRVAEASESVRLRWSGAAADQCG